MAVFFPSIEFFMALQERFNADPGCTEPFDPSDAYCGLSVGEQLFVLEFDGRECSAVVAGGNEIDLDFVVDGPPALWRRILEGIDSEDIDTTLSALIEKGELEIRSVDDQGESLASAALPFIQAFIGKARGLDVDFG